MILHLRFVVTLPAVAGASYTCNGRNALRCLSRKTTYGKLLGMTQPPDYIPKPGDPVKVEGVIIELVVVSVNFPVKTALVASPGDLTVSYPVPWSKIARFP